MKDGYLWNGEGEPDAEVARLEEVLRPLQHRARPLEMPAPRLVPVRPGTAPKPIGWRGAGFLLALAATLVLLLRVLWPVAPPVSSRWTVELTPASGLQRAAPRGTWLNSNEWLVTAGGSRARLRAEGVGVVEVEPGSRVRLVRSTDDEHRLALSVGVMHAIIWAPPGQFSVETPSATAIDLGCAYTLEVDAAGTSRLRVTSGWVGLARDGHEAFVPSGAVCRTNRAGVLGTPRREDAAPAFVQALDALDAARGPAPPGAVDSTLREARPQDAFSLWHLLTRPLGTDAAARVYTRLAALAPPPAPVTRDLVLAGDRAALDAWWDSLGIGDARWYRAYRARTAAGR